MDVPHQRLLPTQHRCALPPISPSWWLHGNYVLSFLAVTAISLTLISVAPKGTILVTVVTHILFI